MNKSVFAAVISLLAGFAAAAIILTARDSGQVDEPVVTSSDYFDQSADADDRIRALEAAVAEERNARQLLEEELQVLFAEIEQLRDGRDTTEEQQVAAARENRERIEAFRQQRFGVSSQDIVSRLVEAGFTTERAEWLQRRESELQMQAMQARFDARRSGEPWSPFDPAFNPANALRAEIGDQQYEQYLQANHRPTAVSVGSVLESSPGQRAGLQPGDQIVRYNGNRVFDVSDLNQQTMLGEPGESVVVDITRDGIPMQLVMPRGPIGVSTARYAGRR
ncbi:MAG: PDZ domain-containing protein [Gammaproteobacteria bacterium]|nr:PDZ domain-containing protein [Gammaproteobacteria bacterium]MDH3429108.1 PDZ domain-containing protein [Gammaproteobacteria bacterium]MDH3433337.1 PDZ domain-containing protein [Gammaproteobacteria bacterium]